MAESSGRELFRPKSLERLSSPERLDQLLVISDRRGWIPLAMLGLIVLTLMGWSIFGRVPINVEGRGILIRPRKIVEFQSPGPGRVVRLAVTVGDTVQRGHLLARIERPDLEAALRLQKQKAAELALQGPSSVALEGGEGGVRTQGPTVWEHIERSRTLASELRRERLEALVEESHRLDEQDGVARELSQSLRERLASQRDLLAQGLISKTDVDRAEELYMDSLERLYDIETQRGALRTAQLEADEEYFDRLQRIAEWDFDLQQDISDVEREIARLEVQIAEESRVMSERAGRVIELSAAEGALVEAGDRLGALEVADPSSHLRSVTYFRVKDGKRLEQGMGIRVTPDTVKRERYGSIAGVIQEVSPYAVSLEEATSVIGSAVVAGTLIEGGFLIQVDAELLRSAENPQDYAWTSSAGPRDFPVSSGTTTTARVAVERERPIAFVIPLLKSATGLE